MRAQRGVALWAALACALLACAAAKAHTYKKGQEVPIWANKGRRAGAAGGGGGGAFGSGAERRRRTATAGVACPHVP